MPSSTWVILAGPDGYAVADEASPRWTREPDGVRAAIEERGYRGEGVLLALDSMLCLAAGVKVHDLPRRGRAQSARFRLEEQLPVALEDVYAGLTASNEHALGVAIEKARLDPMLVELHAAGIAVRRIIPIALLAFQAIDTEGCDACLWQVEDRIEIFVVHNREVRGWYTCAATAGAADAQLRPLATETSPLRLALISLEPVMSAAAAAVPNVQVVRREQRSLMRTALDAAGNVLRRRIRPLIDFSEYVADQAADALVRPLRLVVVAAAVFLICLSAAVLFRGLRYRTLADQSSQRQVDLFRYAIPNQPPPAAIRSRLASELSRLQGTAHRSIDETLGPPPLPMLYQALSSLPRDVRFKLFEMRFSDDGFRLAGHARSHADADAVARALRSRSTLHVNDPRTEQINPATVSFSIVGDSSARGAR